MTLIRTSLLNGIAVLFRMLSLLGLNKILAVYVGPSGYAIIGQFQNAMQMITTFASGAINTGVTKYTAEYYDDEKSQHLVWQTAGSVALIGSLVTSFLIVIFNKQLASWFFNDITLGGVFNWFAATLNMFVMNALLLAILNGKKEVGRYVIANIAGSVSVLIFTAFLVNFWGLYGSLVALAVFQSAAFIVTLMMCYRAKWFKFIYLAGKINLQVAKKLGKYTLVALISAICAPLSQILVRTHLVETLGIYLAGCWEAMWRLSLAYLMLVTTTLSVYYLPRFSELKDKLKIRHEIIQGYKIILPFVAVGGIIIVLFKNFIISILFTDKFFQMSELFAWQMTGDFFKVGGWLLGFTLLGREMIKTFIISEIVFSFSLVLLVIILTGFFGFKGVAIAHAVNYFLYWTVLGTVLHFNLKN